jgi:glycosyltransferase involved in cell wall biosynthesis
MLKGAAKAGAFRGTEAFVLTSHQENFGIAVAEALAYGKPVLISNQINIWREIEAGGAGIVAPDTVEGATHVIQTWESMTPEQRLEMGQAARSVYEANFTVEAAAKDLTAALLRAVQNDERVKS